MSKKGNSFFTSLEGNIRAASHAALVKSVVADPHQTIGQILDSLAEQEEAKYLLEAFKDMSIGQILEGAVNLARTMEPDSDAIIKETYRRLTSRQPDEEEWPVLRQLLKEQEEHFATSPDAARELISVGASMAPETDSPARLAAVTTLVSTVMNFDECITKR